MLKLYGYWRSSASSRVRIALNLKGIKYEYLPIDIVGNGGEQFSEKYRALNPQSRVPFLVDGDFGLGQSLAILDYLEAQHPSPALVPADAKLRARMWAFCHAIAADIQPLQNTGPLAYLTRELGEDKKNAWVRHWIERGFVALEAERKHESTYSFGESPTLADCVLVPQMLNAERFNCDLKKFPRLHAVSERCRKLEPFAAGLPERQPDAPKA